jgi:alpha-1,3-rhamnosyl/mannosyltransferase
VELEVLGDAAILVDPSSPEKWADALQHVLTSRTAGETLRRKGLARVERLTVGTQAVKTLELYQSLLSGGVRRASQSRAS